MRNLLRKAVQCTVLVTVMMIGCSKPGSEFVGKWVNSTDATDTMTIARSGDNFTVSAASGPGLTATYNNGTLTVPGSMGMLSLTYVKSSDTLLAPGLFGQVTYNRAK